MKSVQQLNEWNLHPDPETLAYHSRQWDSVYESTVAFSQFADKWLTGSRLVLDIGCGAGANTAWLASQYANTRFIGLDISRPLIEIARAKSEMIANVNYMVRDLYNLNDGLATDGVVLLQVLSWLPSYETPLEEICRKIKPKWLAFSGLFYNGDISCKIEVDEPLRPRKSFYNIYAVPRVAKFMQELGYRMATFSTFEIDCTLTKPDNPNIMKTYTVGSEAGVLQISGPLMLPWGFIAFERL